MLIAPLEPSKLTPPPAQLTPPDAAPVCWAPDESRACGPLASLSFHQPVAVLVPSLSTVLEVIRPIGSYVASTVDDPPPGPVDLVERTASSGEYT